MKVLGGFLQIISMKAKNEIFVSTIRFSNTDLANQAACSRKASCNNG